MNLEVNVTKRVLTPAGKRFCPVVLANNGRIKPDMVLVNGKPEKHPKALTTSNGMRVQNGCGCLSARMRQTQAHEDSARKQN